MSKNTWGPDLWHILHTIAKAYPMRPSHQDKNIAYQMTKYLALILPCKKCSTHYISNFTKYKPELDSGPGFFKWTVKIHNHVNKSNKLKSFTPEQAFKSTPNILSSKRMSSVFGYLMRETAYGNVSKLALTRFIDTLTYLSRYSAGVWTIPANKDIHTSRYNRRGNVYGR